MRERHLERCGPDAAALYLFLLTVADAEGLSYYAETSIAARLGLEPPRLLRARERLLRAELIAFEPPLYQVLELPAPPAPGEPRTGAARGPRSLAEIIAALGAQPR